MEGALDDYFALSPDGSSAWWEGAISRSASSNRCTQAVRQPGSSFKPLIDAAALDKGYRKPPLPSIRRFHTMTTAARNMDAVQLRPAVLGADTARRRSYIPGMWLR